MSDAVKLMGKRQNVALDVEQYAQLKAYSNLTGVPVSVLVRRAMAEYIEVTIRTKLQTLTDAAHSDAAEKATATVITMPSPVYSAADAMSEAPTLESTGAVIADDLPSWVTKSEQSN
jgi:hypothetical protein